jgi:hypothetical protein
MFTSDKSSAAAQKLPLTPVAPSWRALGRSATRAYNREKNRNKVMATIAIADTGNHAGKGTRPAYWGKADIATMTHRQIDALSEWLERSMGDRGKLRGTT